MSPISGTRTSIRTPVASRKKRDNEEIWGAESEIRSAKRVKRVKGFAYLAEAEEDLEAIGGQFSRLAERKWTTANAIDWSETRSARSARKAPGERIEAKFSSIPITNVQPRHRQLSPNPLNITTRNVLRAILTGHSTADLGVSLEQISLRRGERAVTSPSEVGGTPCQDLLSNLLQIWRKDEMDLIGDCGSSETVFYPPDDEEGNMWKTIDMQELTSLDDGVLESSYDVGRWKVDMERPKTAVVVLDPTLVPEPSQTVWRRAESTGLLRMPMRGVDNSSEESGNAFMRAERVAEMEHGEHGEHDAVEALLGLDSLEEDAMTSMDWKLGWDIIHRFAFDRADCIVGRE